MVNRIVLNANGLNVTKSTFDVLTETNPNNFIFNSSTGGTGVFMSGSVTGVTSATISFGTTFSYIPFTLVYNKFSGTTTSNSGIYSGGLTNTDFTGTATTSSLALNSLVSTSTYYYIIFYMKAR